MANTASYTLKFYTMNIVTGVIVNNHTVPYEHFQKSDMMKEIQKVVKRWISSSTEDCAKFVLTEKKAE